MDYVMKMAAQRRQSQEEEPDEDSSSSSSSSNGEAEEAKEVEEREEKIEYKRRVLKGSFMPAICMLEMKIIDVEAPVDGN